MKRNIVKIICIVLTVSLISGLGMAGAYAAGTKNGVNASKENNNIIDSMKLTDSSDTDIETVYVLTNADGNADNLVVSSTKREDLDYETDTTKLPVIMKVTYTLDGKDVSAEDIKGVTGHVVIRFDYINNTSEKVNINGFEEDIHVPFVAVTGVLLENAHFTNINVTGGKLLDDGDRTAVMGITFPGLQEDLAVDLETFEIPESFEIEADVTDFELESTYTIVTNNVFESFDTSKLDAIDDLKGKANELTSAMTQLITGSDKLHDGLSALLTGANQLAAGITQLDSGLNTLAKNNKTLNGGARQIFDSILATSTTNLRAAGLEIPDLTADNYYTVLKAVLAKLGVDIDNPGQAAADPTVKSILTLKAQLDGVNTFYQGLLQYTAGVSDAAAGADKLNGSTPSLINGIKQLEAGSGELSTGIKTFNEQGIQKIIDAFNGDISSIATRLAPISEAAARYKSYSGNADACKFIYKTSAIK
ncbi:MAG: hypothetical protein K6E39_00380 [Lachnospiraceae bacterium]|nr:hypothetical protein [Lachnospiraceae bacterium]